MSGLMRDRMFFFCAPVRAGTGGRGQRRIVPHLFCLEKFVRPRYWPLARGQDEFVIEWLCVVLAVALIAPVPLGNWLSAFSIALLSTALLQRDGILLLIGLTVAVLSLTFFVSVLLGAFLLAEQVFSSDPSGMGRASPWTAMMTHSESENAS